MHFCFSSIQQKRHRSGVVVVPLSPSSTSSPQPIVFTLPSPLDPLCEYFLALPPLRKVHCTVVFGSVDLLHKRLPDKKHYHYHYHSMFAQK